MRDDPADYASGPRAREISEGNKRMAEKVLEKVLPFNR
jgi:hypothetical protein